MTLRGASEYPLAAQSRELPVREFLEKRYGWLFDPAEPALVAITLQLLRQVLIGGTYLLLTSQLDALRDLEDGTLSFIPLVDEGLRPQTINIAVDARRPLPRAARLVGEALAEMLPTRLAKATAAVV